MHRFPRRTVLSGLATAVALTALPLLGRAQTAQPPKHKALIQVSDNDAQKWNLALNNARNMQDDLNADAIDLEIVVYGPGIDMLKADSPAFSASPTRLATGESAFSMPMPGP